MNDRTRLGAIALLACAVAASSAAAALRGTAAPPTVSSTIDGRKVLPLRLHWIARTSLAPAKVAEVDFLIDGKVHWIEHHAPYNYASDEDGRNLGFLITTWLKPGIHRFGVRVVPAKGAPTTRTVSARVLPAPAPPAALAGRWSRTVTEEDLAKAGPDAPPGGRWELVFDHIGAWHLDPLGSGVVNQYDVAANVLHVYAPIEMAPCNDDKCGISAYGHRSIGGHDCNFAGPFGSYRFAVSGDKLTLTAIHERCPNRLAIWEGVWTRPK